MPRSASRSRTALAAALLLPVVSLTPTALSGCSSDVGGPVPQDPANQLSPEEQEQVDAEESAI